MTMIDSMGHSGSWLLRSSTDSSPTSHPGLGVVSSSLFRGGVSASRISALRLVDGAGSGIGNNGGDAQAPECILVHDPPASWDQVYTLENVVPAPTSVRQPPSKDPQMEYSKIVPQSEQKYR
ncbi:hypothetical protein Tco_0758921 [Tanacetum coccineum]